MSATVNVILDSRRIKTNNKYPLKLRVTFERHSEYYQTVFDLSKDDHEKLSASRTSNELQIVRDKIREIERTAETAAAKVSPFDFAEFEKDFIRDNNLLRKRKEKSMPALEDKNQFDYSPFVKKFPLLLEDKLKPEKIFYHYLRFIKKVIIEGRISSAMYYHCSYVSLKKFRGNVRFEEVSVLYLHEYENWLKQKNITKTTIGMYLRPLRTIFNEAIEEGIIRKEKCYPFGRHKYRIPAAKNTKKALDLSDVKKIYYYQCDPKNLSEQRAKDLWLFSYFGTGMNPKDIACLQFKNIHDGYIIFERVKTERALRGDPKPITVFLTDDMQAIIDRWGNKDKSPNNYIFPIMEAGVTPLRQYELMQLLVKFIND